MSEAQRPGAGPETWEGALALASIIMAVGEVGPDHFPVEERRAREYRTDRNLLAALVQYVGVHREPLQALLDVSRHSPDEIREIGQEMRARGHVQAADAIDLALGRHWPGTYIREIHERVRSSGIA